MAESRRATEVLEWIVAAAGCLTVLLALGFLLYRAVALDDTPPAVIVEVTAVAPVADGYRVQFEARNEGTLTAAALRVEGVLQRDGDVVERSEATIDYLPGGSERTGGLLFGNDPRVLELDVRARGYEDP